MCRIIKYKKNKQIISWRSQESLRQSIEKNNCWWRCLAAHIIDQDHSLNIINMSLHGIQDIVDGNKNNDTSNDNNDESLIIINALYKINNNN